MKMVSHDIKKLAEKIAGGNSVFFGGAGVSTESGIPDFRSAGGLYSETPDSAEYGDTPEEMLSHSFFVTHTEEFFRYYKRNLIYPDAKPNKAHISLSKLEKAGYLKAVITQNVDGLHQKAGSENVLELHGNGERNFCMKCGKLYGIDYVIESKGVPLCGCGGIVKPDVVLYEERLDERVTSKAVRLIRGADTLIIGGTSLAVYPAAIYVTYFEGDTIALINRDATPYDSQVDIILRDKIGEVLDSVCTELGL